MTHQHQSNLRIGRRSEPLGLYFGTKCVLRPNALQESQRLDLCSSLQAMRANGRIMLHAFVIMPDHWHALFHLTDKQPLPTLMKEVGRHASLGWRRSGIAYAWQDGYHDHKLRDDEVVENIIAYIEANPVRRQLVSMAGEWPWSSAHREYADKLDRSFLGFGRWRGYAHTSDRPSGKASYN